ncbi:hypothetical protein ACG7TL_007530 [Trametes sanguinea]
MASSSRIPEALERALRAEGPYGAGHRDRDTRDKIHLQNADQALSFARAIFSRHPSDPLRDLSPRLVLGFGITARRPPLTEHEAKTIWYMLRRMTHLEELTLEDPDGLLMLIPTPELTAAPLLLPQLKHLKYCMSFSIDFCHDFLTGLQRSQLQSVVIRYPKEYDQESDSESSDPFALLAKPCCVVTLETLEVENLRYEYFDLSARVQFPLLGTLSLEFALDNVSPRMPIVGYLLACIPNLSDLDIATFEPPVPWSRHQQPSIRDIRAANVHAQLNSRTSWRLDRVSATLLDFWLLGLRFPVHTIDIRQVDLFTAERTNNLMHDLFNGTAPQTLYVGFRETQLSPTNAIMLFLGHLRAYWIASPHGYVPKVFELSLCITQLGSSHPQASAFALLYESIRLESYSLHVHFACKNRHNERFLALGFQVAAMVTSGLPEESDDSDSDGPDRRNLAPCGDAQRFFMQMPQLMRDFEAVIGAAQHRGLRISIRISSYCDKGRLLLSQVPTSNDRVRRWLRNTARA